MKTVRELIEKLQAVDPDALVALDGFDFLGAWSGEIEVMPSGTVLLLYDGSQVNDDGTPEH